MKKKDLTKVIGISFLVFVVLSWFIPTGSYSSGAFTNGDLAPIGIYDLVKIVLGIFGNYTIYGIIFLLIGGLYSVMNKTGVYSNMVESIAKKFEGKGKNFLALSIITFALLGSVSGFNIALFILVPLFVAVIMYLGYDRFTALLSTVGAIMIGNIGSTYGFEISGYLNLYYGLDMNADMITKVIFLVILILVTILFVTKNAKIEKIETKKKTTKTAKKETKTSKTATKKKSVKEEKEVIAEEKRDIPFYEVSKKKNTKSVLPLAIIFIVTFLLLVIGLYNFQYAFTLTFFNDIYTSVTSFEIAGFPLFKYLLGSMNPYGSWNLGEIGFVLVIVSFLIGWIYSLKFKETWEAMKDGMKQMVPVAIIAILANIVMYLVLPSSSTGLHSNVFVTMNNWVVNLTGEFNWFTSGIGAFLGSFFYNDFKYLIDCTAATMATMQTDATVYPALAMLYQALHGLVMLFAPVSLMLMAGLAYLKISFKDWFKYIWKFLLQILLVIVIVVAIMLAFV